jgi:bacterioferritin (cytochrome b1)
MSETENKKEIDVLNKILELELAGVVRYHALLADGLRLQPHPHRLVVEGKRWTNRWLTPSRLASS